MVLLYAQNVKSELEIFSEHPQPASHGPRTHTFPTMTSLQVPLALYTKNTQNYADASRYKSSLFWDYTLPPLLEEL